MRTRNPICFLTVVLLSASVLAGEVDTKSDPGIAASHVPANVLDRIHFRSMGPTQQGGRIMDFGVPDHFGQPDEEVSIYGRPLEIWIHPQPDWRERDYKHVRAKPGEYTVKVLVNGGVLTGTALVLQDQWYDKTY